MKVFFTLVLFIFSMVVFGQTTEIIKKEKFIVTTFDQHYLEKFDTQKVLSNFKDQDAGKTVVIKFVLLNKKNRGIRKSFSWKGSAGKVAGMKDYLEEQIKNLYTK